MVYGPVVDGGVVAHVFGGITAVPSEHGVGVITVQLGIVPV